MSTQSDFESKTWIALAQLRSECAKVRRCAPTSHACTACKWCVRLSELHAKIDDHLLQLEGKAPDETPAKLNAWGFAAMKALGTDHGNPSASTCGICGRSRYINTRAARVCFACDHAPMGGEWEVSHEDRAES